MFIFGAKIEKNSNKIQIYFFPYELISNALKYHIFGAKIQIRDLFTPLKIEFSNQNIKFGHSVFIFRVRHVWNKESI